MEFPTGGDGAKAHEPAGARCHSSEDSRFGAIPKPTVESGYESSC
ncbi:hypothetical protein WQQ_15790 [Hydrocarboniphaga effusa AP103]|uniref:Uncharacterized protein n=1 Tax=Hydrocarboniphaga effusa AP103 TaxID=1172194 RepID=I7ZI66_9GAMM|nr:hypothetical protein WQQ_15790 [Hydrocarboniphaga effusa AP103]